MSANDQLADAFLRNTKFKRFFNLRVNAVTNRPRFLLHGSEIFSACCRFDSKHVFHHENTRLKQIHVAKKLFVKVPSGIINHARPIVCAITFPHR